LRVLAALAKYGVVFQCRLTILRKSACSVQKFSNLKILDLGMELPKEIIKGV
jgi:hypothetical protein